MNINKDECLKTIARAMNNEDKQSYMSADEIDEALIIQSLIYLDKRVKSVTISRNHSFKFFLIIVEVF